MCLFWLLGLGMLRQQGPKSSRCLWVFATYDRQKPLGCLYETCCRSGAACSSCSTPWGCLCYLSAAC